MKLGKQVARIGLLAGMALTVASAVAFELCVYGYAVYTTRFADFNSIYGPIGAVLAFLLLVYLLAAIVLLGAETAAARRLPHRESAL